MVQAISLKSKPRGYYHSSSFKMALFFTVLLSCSVGVLGYFGHYFSRGHLVYGTEKIIDATIENLVLTYSTIAGAGNILVVPPAQMNGRLIAVLDTQGSIIAGNLKALPDEVSLLTEGTVLFKDTLSRIEYAAKVHTLDDGKRLFVAVDVTEAMANYRFMKNLSLLSIVLVFVVILTSFMISTFVVSRTNRIAQTAKRIMDTGNLSQRIEVDSQWDDLSNMSMVLNGFLEKIEELVEGVQKVSDNIAHDLRTPLTRLRNNLESLRKQDAIAGNIEAAARCEKLLAESDHLLSTFNALLRIARIEAGKQRHNFATLHLQKLLHDVVELYEPLAEEKNIKIICEFSSSSILGDRDLLFQAFANILDNAIKYSPCDARISFSLAQSGSGTVVSIADEGIGIAEAERAKVFDRFYRSEASRHTAGNGLGLSLVLAVASLHRAEVKLSDNGPGLVFKVIFQELAQD